jgi:hypothetical protein
MRVVSWLWGVLALAACASSYGPPGEDPEEDDSGVTPDAAPAAGPDSGGRGAADAAEPTNFTLSVTLAGSGTGDVVSSPAGVVCTGSTCTGSFPPSTPVTLTATPDAGSILGGWTGACTAPSTCTVVMNADIAVTVDFSSLAGTWTGTYSNIRNAYGCTFQNMGNWTMTVTTTGAVFSASASIDGLQLRYVPSCSVCCSAASSANANGTVSGATLTGQHDFYIAEAGSSLSFPWTATVSGNTMTGSWNCSGCSGSFTLTRQP